MKQTFFLRLLVVILLAGVLLPFLISDRLGLTVFEPFLQRLNHHYVATSAKTMGYWLSLQEESQLQEEFASISELYPVPMALFQSHNMALTPEQRRSLKAGNTLYLSIPSSQQAIEQGVEVGAGAGSGAVQKYFIHQIPGSDYLFSFASPDRELVNVTTYATAEALGTLALLQKYFQSAPQAQWPDIIEQLAPVFPHPLYLLPLTDLNSEQALTDWKLSQHQHKALNDGQVVTITEERALMNYGTGLNYFMQRLDDSQWIVVGGPVAPKIRQQIDRYMLISQGFLAALVIVLLFIWLLPTWHASRSLMISAKAFSMGNRSSRARGYKLSHFRPVTDTFNQMAEDIESDFRANQQLIQTLSQNMSPCISEIEASLNQLEVQINNSEKIPLARGVESLSEQEVIDLIEKNTEQLTLLTSNALVEARLASGASENLSSGLFKANTNGNRL